MKKFIKLSLTFIGAITLLSQGAVFAKDTITTTTAPSEETVTVTAGVNQDEGGNSSGDANTEQTSTDSSKTDSDLTTTTLTTTTTTTVKKATATTTKKNKPVLFSDGNIQIDGYFDDWEDKPMTSVGWPGSPVVHYISLYRDENFIYLYVKLDKNFPFTGAAYCINYEGKNAYFDVRCDGTIPNDGIAALTVRAQNNWKDVPNSQGFVKRAPGESDMAEAVIPISEFDNNVKPDEVQSISFSTPNYGPQKVSCTGTGTAPFINSGIGLAIACTGYVAMKKKRNKLK